MADILRITSAAVESLLSASSNSSTTSTAAPHDSFSSRVRVSGRKVREISLNEVLQRSSDEGVNLAEFLNPRSSFDISKHDDDLPLNLEHRTATPGKDILATSILADESRHLVAPSTCSSDLISIIDVGQSQTLSSESRSEKPDLSLSRGEIDLIPVRDGEASSTKNTSSSTTVSSLKTADVVQASTPNTSSNQVDQITEPLSNSIERPRTPDLSDQPPALPSLNLPVRGLRQGSLASLERDRPTSDQIGDRIEIKTSANSGTRSARLALQESNPQKRGAVPVQRLTPSVQQVSQPVPDQTSQIAAAVAAAVAATTPFHQLKHEIEQKLDRLSAELVTRNSGPQISRCESVNSHPSSIEPDHSLDVTLMPESEGHSLDPHTPINPRIAPKPRSHAKPAKQNTAHPGILKKPRQNISAQTLRSQFEVTEDDSQFHGASEPDLNQTKEYVMVKDDILRLLQEAKDAKRDIEEIRHTERMQALRTATFKNETPADIYLESIRERENEIYKPKYAALERQYRTPDYILEGKNILYEIEEKRKSFEEKRYPLDSTYLCADQEQSSENEEISKRISGILDNIQSELKSKNPKKTTITADPPKPKVRKPKASSKLQEKKELYAKLKAESDQFKQQSKLQHAKQKEGEKKEKKRFTTSMYKSPYQRPGLPKSFPLAPIPFSSSFAAPSFNQFQSTLMAAPKHQVSVQTSPFTVERVDPRELPSRHDVSVMDSRVLLPQMIDQQCSPFKQLPSHHPLLHSTVIGEDDVYDPNDFIGIVDLPQSVTVKGSKAIPPEVDRFTSSLKGKAVKKPYNPPVIFDEDKLSVMQWLEDEILEKLLQDQEDPQEDAATQELRQLLGDDVLKQIRGLNLNLTPNQLHMLVTDAIKETVDQHLEEVVTELKVSKDSVVSPDKSQADESKRTYDETFESDPSSSTSSSKSSLSVALTPTLSELPSRDVSLASVSSHIPSEPRSPLLTPPPSPGSRHSSPADALPEGVPAPHHPRPSHHPQGLIKVQPLLDDTLEQIPLDLTDENVSLREPVSVFTPDLTSKQEGSLSLHGSLAQEPMTPMNTATVPVRDLGDTTPAQHPLDKTGQSLISQNPLELSEESEKEEVSMVNSEEITQAEITESVTTLYSDTTDHPISAGEVIPGVVPRELLDQVYPDRPLSEGEWPLSPHKAEYIKLVRDPQIRELLEMQMKADMIVRLQDDTIPEIPDLREDSVVHTPQSSPPVHRGLPPAPKRVPISTPSPLPKTQSAENFETLELVTPLPDNSEHFDSPSPLPFMGLQLEDYNYSEESVTKSDSF